jgi:DNA-directed RNA polymerase subunit K/omega
LQARHRFRRDVVALRVARQAEEGANVVLDLLGDVGNDDLDRGMRRAERQASNAAAQRIDLRTELRDM